MGIVDKTHIQPRDRNTGYVQRSYAADLTRRREKKKKSTLRPRRENCTGIFSIHTPPEESARTAGCTVADVCVVVSVTFTPRSLLTSSKRRIRALIEYQYQYSETNTSKDASAVSSRPRPKVRVVSDAALPASHESLAVVVLRSLDLYET